MLQKQKKDELRNRGNPDTYTMDAKFDERFKLGYEIGGDKVRGHARHAPSWPCALLPVHESTCDVFGEACMHGGLCMHGLLL